MKTKKSLRIIDEESSIAKTQWLRFYRIRAKQIFLALWKIEGLTEEENRFIFSKLYERGNICSFNLVNSNVLAFAPFTPRNFNMYMYPINIDPIVINTLNSSIPVNLNVKEDTAICYLLPEKLSLASYLRPLINKIVSVEMTLRTYDIKMKLPWLWSTDIENKDAVNDIIKRVYNDEAVVMTALNTQNIGQFNSTNVGALKDLYTYKKNLISELLIILGVNWTNIEKQERLLVAEAHAGDDYVELSRNLIRKPLETFIKDTNNIFNKNFKLINILDEKEKIDDEKLLSGNNH